MGCPPFAIMMIVVFSNVARSSLQHCSTFSSINDDVKSFNCSESCLASAKVPAEKNKEWPVFGTVYYHKESDVCLAALHAGAVSTRGGLVTFTRDNTAQNIRGTIQHRVVSQSMPQENSADHTTYKFLNITPVVTQQDLAEDVIIVHNSYSEKSGQLDLTCLASDTNRTLTGTDIVSWRYTKPNFDLKIFQEKFTESGKCVFPYNYGGKEYWECSYIGSTRPWCGTDPTSRNWDYCTKNKGRWAIYQKSPRGVNVRAVRCLGRSSATDVLAVVQVPHQFYVSLTSTIRASLGDHLSVLITKFKDLPRKVFIRRLPDGWVYEAGTTADVSLPLTFDPVTLGDAGIYILGNDGTSSKLKTFNETKAKVETNGAYLHLIVRECESDRYGPQCQSWCPDCQNGGICHAVTGTCVCAPGYSGPTCQHACPRGSFGSSCQFTCQKTTLGFSPATEGQCEKLTICLPEPYGCSCAPGYTGPFCDQECPAGRYGAGCSHDCDYCKDNHCDSVSGSCTRGCKNEAHCTSGMPLDLPRLRTPPSLTDITNTSVVVNFSTWTREEDDGSEAVGIVSYLLQYRREDDDTWTTVKSVPHSSVSGQTKGILNLTVEHLSPGYQYTLRVLVNTSRGAADGSTNKRVHHVTFVTLCSAPRLDNLRVLNVTNQSAVVTWTDNGNHERCGIQYEVKLTSTPTPEVLSLQTTRQPSHHLSGLAPDTRYQVFIAARYSGTQVITASYGPFSTLPNAPTMATVSVGAGSVGSLTVSWTLPPGSSRAHYFNITYRLLQHKACGSPDGQRVMDEERRTSTNRSSIVLEGLESYAEYGVCVTGSNRGGTSQAACSTAVTLSSNPSVGVEMFSCKQTDNVTTTCTAGLTGCDTYNGPDVHVNVSLETYLQCSNTTLEFHKLSNISGGKCVAEFMNLTGGMTFVATLSITNNVSRMVPVKTTVNFTTTDEKPPEVRNFTVNSLSSNKVRLLWNDPCPSNGVITGFMYKEASRKTWTPIGTTACSEGYDRCVDVDGLRANTNYTFWVSAVNSAGRGRRQEIWMITMETKPGPPQQLDVVPHDSSLDLQLWQPHLCGGRLHNFTIQLKNKTILVDNCTKDAPDPTCSKDAKTIPAERLTCQMSKLKPGRRYEAEAFFCNAAGCGKPFVKTVATLPIPPKLSGKFQVKSKTNTTVTLALPTFTMEGEGDRSVAILVSRLSEDAQDVAETFTATYIKLVAEGISQNRSASGGERVRRQAGDHHCEDTNRTYIAAVLTQAAEEFAEKFVVGEMTNGGPYPNCPLKPAHPYIMAVVARVQLEGRSAYAEMKLDEKVVPEWDGYVLPIVSSVLGLLLLILIITIIIIFRRHKTLHRKVGAKYWKDRHRTEVYDNGRAVQDLSNYNTLPLLDIPITSQSQPNLPSQPRNVPAPPDPAPPPPPPLIPDAIPPAVEEENVYENIYKNNFQEDIYCNFSRRVAFDDVEAYLNKAIGAHDTSEDFMSVPSNVGKSMSVGEHLENKKKNRYRNNLPYDETRVELSVINNDPFSNYINANHVYGFGGVLKYVASQGPKEANVSTLGDFWRMICEHHIYVIIMVANFEEGGKKKVGKYLDFGGALMIDDYKVEVIKTDHHSNYNVSLVQVWKNGIAHTVTHYHYLSWPDHGVPTEAHSLATMIRQVIHTHSEGGVVVHCSAGIGRTGTVLLVLLLHEMLMVQGSMDPLEVLQRLRDCRARLVENVAQYNLGLQIFDELLYGDNTVIPSVSAHDQMKEFMRTSHDLYQKALALPSALTFRVSSQGEYYPLNRNPAVVPADTRRIFLEMEGGEMLSQYINAVRLDGLDEPNTMIATEHPLPSMLNKFWKLVVEKKCPSIILINTFDGYEKEFPCVLPGPDCDLQVGRYTVRTLHVTPYKSFDLYSIEVFSQQNVHQTVSVYQLTSWPYGTQVPPSPQVLVAVSEMLLQSPRSPEAGPLLLSCGDGVTGCGLLAGALLTIENLQKSDKIDVYRTVVKLRRARPQFFVSQDQFELLYSAAVVYLENYDTYVNFPV
ncbi:receptor-type tyrosine-protein phosphatase S isoform X1 [Procambarus clarkii]|uniref:receptor-type tyrosine-protein phosphatase S isoform X1 n=1 Tax=Procambarus clarkii TaxID=6728 RepID=UPI0037439618